MDSLTDLCKDLTVVERVSRIRMTVATAQLLRAFLADVSQRRYGYELMEETGFPSGKLYPILARLTSAGWLVREREDIDPVVEGRPARYLYVLTEGGTEAARVELAALSRQLAVPPPSAPRLQPQGGRA
jgi:PadR family transcriptional regulator, regulatory protein PadR